MLNETLVRLPRVDGRQPLVIRGRGGATELSVARLRVPADTTAHFVSNDEETIVVLQHGQGTFGVDEREWRVGRRDVFSERATALYVPPGVTLRVTASTA